MNNDALIGYSGFIGSNLINQREFSFLFNSKNISDIKYKTFDTIISCGNSATKWMANKNPKQDYENIITFIENIKSIKVKKFILISTIDVYDNPYDVDETIEANCSDFNPYGKNRLILENFIKNFFDDYLIVRLPIVYGHGFKKNIIFDALNNNQLDKINGNTQVQIYNVKNLNMDLYKFSDKNLRIVNLATEPITVGDLYKTVFHIETKTSSNNYIKYDMKTMHNNAKKYFYDKIAIVEELKIFKEEYETKRI